MPNIDPELMMPLYIFLGFCGVLIFLICVMLCCGQCIDHCLQNCMQRWRNSHQDDLGNDVNDDNSRLFSDEYV